MINKATATITVDSETFNYDGNSHSLDIEQSGAVNGEALTYDVSGNAQTNVGEYDVKVTTPTTGVDANYNIVITNGKLTIKANGSSEDEQNQVQTNNKTITEGDPTPTFTVTYGNGLKHANLENSDFIFTTVVNGKLVVFDGEAPTTPGVYSVNLNETGQGKVRAQNPGSLLNQMGSCQADLRFLNVILQVEALPNPVAVVKLLNLEHQRLLRIQQLPRIQVFPETPENPVKPGDGGSSGNSGQGGSNEPNSQKPGNQNPDVSGQKVSAGQADLTITNTKQSVGNQSQAEKLPQTSERGENLFVLLGLILMSVLGLLGLARRKKQE